MKDSCRTGVGETQQSSATYTQISSLQEYQNFWPIAGPGIVYPERNDKLFRTVNVLEVLISF